MISSVRVRRFKCLCGNTRMVHVIKEGEELTPDVLEEFKILGDAGCESDVITLEEARKVNFCFDCKIV